MQTEGIVVLVLFLSLSLPAILFAIIYSNILNKKREQEVIKTKSPLIQSIERINNIHRSKFVYNIKNKHLNPQLKSRRGLENFDFEKYIENHIAENINYYRHIINTVKENITLYSQYSYLYSSLKPTTLEEFKTLNLGKIKYHFFSKCEIKHLKTSKLHIPPQSFIIHCLAEYISPAGNVHLRRSETYSLKNISRFIEKIELQKTIKETEQIHKEELAARKREKERKLRELEKYEKQLQKKENDIKTFEEKRTQALNKYAEQLIKKESDINQKTKEFEEATKDHIYSSNGYKEEKVYTTNTTNLSLYQKLKMLKDKFDSGEISYDEYEKMRKELLQNE